MSVLDRAQRGFTVDRVSGAADLAVKFAAIVIAVGAISLVFFGPKIEIRTFRQTFIDRAVLRSGYERAGTTVPQVVSTVAAVYNRANEKDLRLQTNASRKKASGRKVCREARELLEQVFPTTNCAPKHPHIGRYNHYWERLLILRVARQADLTLDQRTAEAKQAVEQMYDSQYVKVRAAVQNNGHARAINVNVRVPTGFSPDSSLQSVTPFTLGSDEAPVARLYRSATGIRGAEINRSGELATGAPATRFGVDWERDQTAQGSIIIWVGLAFFILWVAVVLNDGRVRRGPQQLASKEEGGDGA
jgi:hypothetical protein